MIGRGHAISAAKVLYWPLDQNGNNDDRMASYLGALPQA
jgi:hypothetical protein